MEIYTGFRNITDAEIDSLHQGAFLDGFHPNQYVITESGNIFKLKLKNNRLELTRIKVDCIRDTKPKKGNIQQLMAFDMLGDRSIPIKFMVGIAGGGKTYLAIRYALTRLKNPDDPICKILFIRNPVPIGEGIGHLKGDFDAKTAPWVKPITDNLDGGLDEFNRMKFYEQIEFDVPDYMQGRSIDNTLFVFEEAQMTTRELMQVVGTRVGHNSEIIINGDYKQAVVNKFKGKKNGLLWAIEMFKNDVDAAVVTFVKSERSTTAEKFAKLDLDAELF